MKTVGILKNPVQHYAWGSVTAIPDILGIPATGMPMAELWMGAHPKSPSEVILENNPVSLKEMIDRNPEEMLGPVVARRFGNRLPYLFKILAAAKPLSIQAHPSLSQATAGFDRENRMGIPLSSPQRNYRDDNHKPEIICALTPFDALCGFRPIGEIVSGLTRYGGHCLDAERMRLKQNPDSTGLKTLFEALMRMTPIQRSAVIDAAKKQTDAIGSREPEAMWINRLAAEYPQDIGVVFPLILNLIRLEPDQALFLPAGEPHAYLNGVGIELMANSDNVLRGGLTPKHVDVDELTQVLTFREFPVHTLSPVLMGNFESGYQAPADEFQLSVITLQNGETHVSHDVRSLEIILCLKGEAVIYPDADSTPVRLVRGTSAVIPAAVPFYRITGSAMIYKARVPFPENTRFSG